MIKLLIYDLDGTLIDSRRDIAEAVNWTLRELGFGELPLERVARFVGSGVRNLMRQALWEADERSRRLLERSVKLFRARYGEHLLVHTRLYPSVPQVLKYMRHCKQAVITNKPDDFSRTILKGLGIDSYFFHVVGGEAGFPKKPAPDGVLEILKRGGVTPAEALLVGDSALDIETARNAGIAVVAVTYGFGAREEIDGAKPDYTIENLEELIECPLLRNR